MLLLIATALSFVPRACSSSCPLGKCCCRPLVTLSLAIQRGELTDVLLPLPPILLCPQPQLHTQRSETLFKVLGDALVGSWFSEKAFSGLSPLRALKSRKESESSVCFVLRYLNYKSPLSVFPISVYPESLLEPPFPLEFKLLCVARNI